jgi:hypothetical protein
MRYYKHNRDRSFGANFYKHRKSFKKLMYMMGTNRSRLLDSCYFESQTWGALHKAWKGYVIAKNKYEYDRMDYYANVIQKLQKELGLTVSSFPDLGLTSQGDNYDGAGLDELTE